jgi:transcriptional regulator with XRE-family HTH domain
MAGPLPIVKRVGARIRELREAQGFSQREFATMVGKARSLVTYVEQGTKVPSLETLAAFATALGVSVAELVAEEPSGKRKNEPGEVVPERCRRLIALLRSRGPEYVVALEQVVKVMDEFAKTTARTGGS